MHRTRILAEGAMLVGLFAILMLAALFIPILGSLVIWVLPLPFIVYVVRYGLKAGLGMYAAAIFLSFIIGGVIGLPFVFLFGTGGLAVGELLRRGKSAFGVLVGGSLTYIGGLVVLYGLSVLLLGIDPVQTSQEMMRDSISTAEGMLESFGQEGNEELQIWKDALNQLHVLIPVILIFTGVTFAIITQLIAHMMLKRLDHSPQAFPPFREWNFPRSLLWYYLLGVVFVLIGVEEGTMAYTVVWNLFPLLEVAMTIQGLTVIFSYTHSKSMGRAIPIVIVVLGLILPVILYLIRILGIIDLGFNLKKRLGIDQK